MEEKIMLKKVLMGFVVSLIINFNVYSDDAEPRKFCLKRCFYQCKRTNQAVKDCIVSNQSMVSFQLKCECRDLNPGEQLPSNQPNYLIKNRASG